MKTLEELKEGIRNLQALAEGMQGDISEVIRASEEKERERDKAEDLTALMHEAERHPVKPHPLSVRSAAAAEAYLTLLLSVASYSTPSDLKVSPVVYPCRIAAALQPQPDMELLLRKSQILDEKSVGEALCVLENEHLADSFLLDSLRLIELYDRGNEGKIGYVSDLAVLLNVSQGRMEDLLTLLRTSLLDDEKFVRTFSETDYLPVLRYISAEHHPITPHPLDGKDAGAVEAYLTLLLSVVVNPQKLCDHFWLSGVCQSLISFAAHDAAPRIEEAQIDYPGRIAMALRPLPNMESFFRKALVLSGQAVHEALLTLQGAGLVDFFLLDALRMIELYDRSNIGKIEYVFDLAALLHLSKGRMDDLHSLLKASMQDQPKLVGAFSETDLTPFLSYISLGECAVRTPNEILVANEGGIKEQEVMDILGFPMKPQKSPDQGAAAQPSAGKPDSGSQAAAGQPAVGQAAPKKVQNKKRVSLLGVHFSGTEGPMLFSDIEEFEISECTFENFQEGCFDIENCQHVSVRNCRFLNCSRPKKSQSDSSDGIIGNFKSVGVFELSACEFTKCFASYPNDNEDTYYSRLFRGAKYLDVKTDSCKTSGSAPIV
ncbi:MAG: right-handed parallel beta-helix repeat-containing protein [Succinivibrionaceae bacterium]|nr:right-handed parallel beta-helix repeat-containing protein [Succinivibrionaceae bacterium]